MVVACNFAAPVGGLVMGFRGVVDVIGVLWEWMYPCSLYWGLVMGFIGLVLV